MDNQKHAPSILERIKRNGDLGRELREISKDFVKYTDQRPMGFSHAKVGTLYVSSDGSFHEFWSLGEKSETIKFYRIPFTNHYVSIWKPGMLADDIDSHPLELRESYRKSSLMRTNGHLLWLGPDDRWMYY